MSEFVSAEFLEKIDSNVFNAITEYDTAKKMYFELATVIRNDLPDKEQFVGTLSAQASELAHGFGEVALATYQAYGIDASKEAMTNLWFYEQAERINFMGAIVKCKDVDCHNDYLKDEISEMVEEFFSDSLDDDSLLDNARSAYFEALQSDAQGFVNHIQAIRMSPSGFLIARLPHELNDRFNTADVRRKVAKVTSFALGISVSGALFSKLLRKDES